MSKSKSKKLKTIPHFKSEAAAAEFWLTHDTTDYVDWAAAQRVVFSNLRPSTKSISLRLPLSLLERLKISANKKDVPYQSLMKMILDEAMKKELRK